MTKGDTLQSALLTDREKAAIRLHVFGGVQDWRLLFDMAGGNTTSPRSYATFVSRWKTSTKVIQEIEAQRRELYARDEAIRQRAREEIERETSEEDESRGSSRRKRDKIDYFDPKNQREKLNELINEASDPDEALDALKVLINTQRDDRQAAKEGRQVRAYLPLNCRDCPLYQKAAKH